MRLSPACSCSSLTAVLLAVSYHIVPTIAVSSGANLFKIPTGSTPGSCDNENIDDIISEASKMATAAITAITNYQKQSFFSAAPQAVLNTYEAAYAMFGVTGTKIANRVVISSAGSATLDKVKTNYQNVINLLNSASTLQNGAATLACDESFLKFVTKLEDINPNLKNVPQGQQTIASFYSQAGSQISSTLPGFYFSNWNGGNIMIADVGIKQPDGSPGGGLCSQTTTKAETWAAYGFILCCPAMFKLAPSLAGVAASQNTIPSGTSIETYQSQPGAFLHEMMHFLGTNTATGKIIDVEFQGTKTYTWVPSSILGTYEPAQALTNADNYHYFAIASYLGNVNFGTDGVSQ